MHRSSPVKKIKNARRASEVGRQVSSLLMKTALDDKELAGVAVSRTELSPDGAVCTILFYSPQGEKHFKEKQLQQLIIYKPSLRKALSQSLSGRYVPELVFAYDSSIEKIMRIEELLEKTKQRDSDEENLDE